MSHRTGTFTASPELAARARAVAERHGLRKVATACQVDRETLLALIARWPQRIATVELLRTRLAELETRGYGADAR